MKTLNKIERIIKASKKELKEKYKVQEAGIFGSFVRGRQTKYSDVDILVEFNEPISLLTRAGLLNYLTDKLGVKVDLVRKRQIRPELRKKILDEIVYLW